MGSNPPGGMLKLRDLGGGNFFWQLKHWGSGIIMGRPFYLNPVFKNGPKKTERGRGFSVVQEWQFLNGGNKNFFLFLKGKKGGIGLKCWLFKNPLKGGFGKI